MIIRNAMEPLMKRALPAPPGFCLPSATVVAAILGLLCFGRSAVPPFHAELPTLDLQANRVKCKVFYISETPTGGSLKYLEDIKAQYGPLGVEFYRLPNKAAAAAAESFMQQGDILIFQYLLNTDFSFTDVRDMVVRHKLRLVIPIHEKYFLNANPDYDHTYSHSLHTDEASTIPADKLQLLAMAEHIIFPSQFIHDVFAKYIKFPSMVVVPHADDHCPQQLSIPPTSNNTLRVGIITPVTYYKGADLVQRLMHACPDHKGKRVRFFWYAHHAGEPVAPADVVAMRGAYNEGDIYDKLRDDQVQGLLFLNRFPETYSYALTKGINTGLPILYTALGAIAERMRQVGGHPEYIATSYDDLEDRFRQLLDYIEAHAGRSEPAGPGLHSVECRTLQARLMQIPAFYDALFLRERVTTV